MNLGDRWIFLEIHQELFEVCVTFNIIESPTHSCRQKEDYVICIFPENPIENLSELCCKSLLLFYISVNIPLHS